MTTGTGNQAAAFARDGELARAWRDLRKDSDIQFSEIELPKQDPPPDWLTNFMKWLSEAIAPLGDLLVKIWPVLFWVLVAGGAALIIWFVWRYFGPDLQARRSRPGEQDEWTPDKAQALALLEEADRLAAQGLYDEATHLLLLRSVGQIAAARPDLVEPATTARELSAQKALPEAARSAFAIIAERVERSLFALRKLGEEDWTAARSAYADFALARKAISA